MQIFVNINYLTDSHDYIGSESVQTPAYINPPAEAAYINFEYIGNYTTVYINDIQNNRVKLVSN